MAAKSFFQSSFAPRLAWQTARITVVLVLLLGAAFVPTGTARALAFTVNTTADTVDAALNGVCADSLGNCSLRAAIMEANASPGSTITFAPALNGTPIRLTITGNENAALQGDLDINANMTITGNGPANTIIQGAADASYTGSIGEKIFGVNDSRIAGTPIDVSFSGMTIRYGDNQIALAGNGGIGGGISIYQSGDGSSATITDCVIEYNRVQHNYGGGVLFYTGTGATNSSLTITNVTFRSNQTLGGTGFYWSGGGLRVGGLAATVTISGSTFEDNSTPSAGLIMSNDGGAISFAQTSGGGSLDVGDSTFSGNSSRAGGAIAVDTGSVAAAINVNIHDSEFIGNEAGEVGGALHFSGSSFTSVTLTEVDISENQAGTYGGGVYVDDMSVTLVHSRIAKNTAPANPLSNGLYKTSEATATVTATRNWWGCSTGPGAAPCDRAFSAGGGTLSYTPWLRDVLTSSGGTTLVTNQSSTLTASFLTDSSGAAVAPANLGQIIGLPIAWGASSGSAAGDAVVSAAGTAIGTFQAAGVGSPAVYAQVDNDNTSPVSSNVLVFTVNPANTTTTITSHLPDPSMVGQAVTFTVDFTAAQGFSPTAATGMLTVSAGPDSCTIPAASVFPATCTITFTTPGSKSVTASYPGDGNFNASTSPAVTHVVNSSPTVTSISSTHLNGAYTVGEIIPITVTFTMPVNVTGVPQLTLETGTTDRVVNYSSGSGTATLTFNYTVQAGDTSADLDYTATNSLALNGGTIRDAVTNTFDAILTLAAPGAVGSLGANKAIVIDTTVPTVTSITSTTANGAYRAGVVIPITVTFSEVVNVDVTGGTPHLTLETGAVDEGIYYTDGSGTNTLTFTYTVQAGDTSPDLDYIATFALSANGGTIQDAATNNAHLTLPAPGAVGSLGANKAIVIDTTVPVITFTSTPTDPTNQSSFTFGFGANETVTGYTCTLSQGAIVLIGPILCSSPVPGSVGSTGTYTFLVSATDLAGNSGSNSFTWTVDLTPPDTFIQPPLPANPTNLNYASFTYDGTDVGSGTAGFQCSLDGAAFAPCASPMPQNYSGLIDKSYTFQVRAVDNAGNPDPSPASYTWAVDTANPTVTMTSTAPDPTNTSPIPVIVQFNKIVTGFLATDIIPGNGAVNNFTAVDGDTYTFNLTPGGQGLVTADIAAGVAADGAGNGNTAAAQFSRTYDSVAATVTIIPAAGQLDPTSGSPINFTATFSETVTGFGLDVTDVTVSGTAGATTAAVTGSGTTYNVAVSGMTGGGTVIVGIPADSAQDAAGNGNSASGNATVTFTPLGITSPNNVTFVAGNLSSFTVTTVGAPPPTLTYTFRPPTVTLPSGIGFVDNGNGTATLSGTPALGSVGTYNLTFTASNGVGPDETQDFTLTIDGPPGVARINSSADTGDGQVLENEHTSANIIQLLVVFNKDMNAGDAGNWQNYHLVRDGSPGELIDPAGVTYDNGTRTAALGILAPVPLPNGRYTLTVEGDIEDTLGVPIGTDFVRVFYVDNGAPTLTSVITIQGGAAIVNGATINVRFSSLDVTFNEDVSDPAGNTDPDDVTNPANYLLVTPGPTGGFDTLNCAAGLNGDDVQVPTGPVTYRNGGGAGPFVATVQLNNGTALPNGLYRLYVCGTTSIVDLAGNPLNSGADDQRTFTVLISSRNNPQTGFAPGVVTVLPEQPSEKTYNNLGNLWIEIPRLNLKADITGVPLTADGWDVTWLHWQVGWLEGTAYPTWEGNTVLTAHGYTADGEAGPFALLKNLSYGDTIIIHLSGMKYTYAIRTNLLIRPDDTRWLTKHETLDWVTLLTCQQYDSKTKSYRYRRVVRAVLIEVEEE